MIDTPCSAMHTLLSHLHEQDGDVTYRGKMAEVRLQYRSLHCS